MTAAKLRELAKKQNPIPKEAMTIPAKAGPAILAALKTVEFRAMAFIRSLCPTSSTTKACLVGISRVLTTPMIEARIRMWP